jgi:hypothetical protein
LRPRILDVADGFADRPDFQRVVWARFEQREQFIVGRRFLAQPLRPITFGEDGRHPVVQLGNHVVGRARQYRAAQHVAA